MVAGGRNVVDLTGQQFGRLLVIARAGSSNTGQAMWLVRCSCGTEKAIRGHSLRHYRARSCDECPDRVKQPRQIRKRYEEISVVEKRCARCDTVKPAADFPRNRIHSSGLYSWCRVCTGIKWKQYYYGKKTQHQHDLRTG